MGLGDDIYEGTASFGVFYALISAVIGTLVGVVMLGIGIWMVSRKKRTESITKGKITQIDRSSTGQCEKIGGSNNYSCEIQVSFDYSGKSYEKFAQYTGNIMYKIGQVIDVYVIDGNPDNIDLQKSEPKWIGWVLIGLGVFFAVAGWFWYWASRRWKIVAAAEGAGGIVGIVTGR